MQEAPLTLLAERRGLEIHDQMLDEVANNREKDYGPAAYLGYHMQLGFLQHSLTISRLHHCIEMACRKSASSAGTGAAPGGKNATRGTKRMVVGVYSTILRSPKWKSQVKR